MKKVRPWCGQPSDRGRLKNNTEQSNTKRGTAWQTTPRKQNSALHVFRAICNVTARHVLTERDYKHVRFHNSVLKHALTAAVNGLYGRKASDIFQFWCYYYARRSSISYLKKIE